MARLGLVRTFQQVSVFGQDTVLANVLQGAHLHERTRLWGALWGTRPYRDRAGELAGRAMAVLERIGLADEAEVQAGALPYGKQKKLGMAVALAGAPRLLMLDEPVAGLNPTESAEIARLIGRLRAEGLTILLVEHDMRTVMSLCGRIVVLSEGVKIAEGLPAEIRRDPDAGRRSRAARVPGHLVGGDGVNLRQLLEERAQAHPDDTAAIISDRVLTWAALDRLANRAAQAMAGAGLAPGDRVAVTW